ncbi:MAG: SNF2-related protein [Gaiellaceae bacterium]
MSVHANGQLLVEHTRTGAQGVLLDTSGRPPNVICSVEFDHGMEDVPKALLRPLWDPFELLSDPLDLGVYPYEGWLRRQRYRLLDAFRNDLALGLSNSRVEPQLHQVSVALRALEKSQPRLILADEVGLGKTIEAGLILKELRARMGVDLGRVLIVVPASLITQWRFELRSKFNEHFVFLDGSEIARIKGERPNENPWTVEPNIICSLQLARMERYAEDIAAASWDLVIVDEAHHARRTLA